MYIFSSAYDAGGHSQSDKLLEEILQSHSIFPEHNDVSQTPSLTMNFPASLEVGGNKVTNELPPNLSRTKEEGVSDTGSSSSSSFCHVTESSSRQPSEDSSGITTLDEGTCIF